PELPRVVRPEAVAAGRAALAAARRAGPALRVTGPGLAALLRISLLAALAALLPALRGPRVLGGPRAGLALLLLLALPLALQPPAPRGRIGLPGRAQPLVERVHAGHQVAGAVEHLRHAVLG